jgi:hypothetical protein
MLPSDLLILLRAAGESMFVLFRKSAQDHLYSRSLIMAQVPLEEKEEVFRDFLSALALALILQHG